MISANDRIVTEMKDAVAAEERHVTVKEKIVLHLGRFSNTEMDFYRMPFGTTQDGIAIAARISRAHASVELKKLKAKGAVKESQAHVIKGVAIRKVYLLTEEGIRSHRKVENDLRERGIDTEDVLSSQNENGCEKRDPYLEMALSKVMKATEDMIALREARHPDYGPVISGLLSTASTLVGKP